MTEKFVVPFKGLSYVLKMYVIIDHYTYHTDNTEECLPCEFMKNVINELPKLNDLVTEDMTKASDSVPEHLKYYIGRSEIKDDFERYMNRVIKTE